MADTEYLPTQQSKRRPGSGDGTGGWDLTTPLLLFQMVESLPATPYPSSDRVADSSQPECWVKVGDASACVLFKSARQSRFLVRYKAGMMEPMHSHTAQAEVLVLEGIAEAVPNVKTDLVMRMPQGVYWVCPPSVPHSVRALTDCTLLHVFHGAPVDVKTSY